jgi:hypothetical protein
MDLNTWYTGANLPARPCHTLVRHVLEERSSATN